MAANWDIGEMGRGEEVGGGGVKWGKVVGGEWV